MESSIIATFQKIISEMDDNSQYTDFIDDFEVIENCLEKDNHVVNDAWLALYASLYAAKGDLSSVKDEIEEFIKMLQG